MASSREWLIEGKVLEFIKHGDVLEKMNLNEMICDLSSILRMHTDPTSAALRSEALRATFHLNEKINALVVCRNISVTYPSLLADAKRVLDTDAFASVAYSIVPGGVIEATFTTKDDRTHTCRQ